MDPFTKWLLMYLAITMVLSFIIGWCQCGKYKPWVFLFHVHPKLPYMVFNLFMCVCTVVVGVFISGSWTSPVLWALFGIMECFRIWYHEKDKIKKAIKALGSVRINQHGKLVIER